MRRAARVDRNHADIVKALRQAGCNVLDLSRVGNGCPDLLVGRMGEMCFMEVKDGEAKPSKQLLTSAEKVFHRSWYGYCHIVRNAQEALQIVGYSPGSLNEAVKATT